MPSWFTRRALVLSFTLLASCGGNVVVDGTEGLGGDASDDASSTTVTTGVGAAGAGSPDTSSGSSVSSVVSVVSVSSVGGGGPTTVTTVTTVTTGTTGGGGSVSTGLAQCLDESGLPPDSPCVGCAYIVTFDSCRPEHLCPQSQGLYAQFFVCVCGAPEQPGVCGDICGEACTGAADASPECSNCILQGCINPYNACANDV